MNNFNVSNTLGVNNSHFIISNFDGNSMRDQLKLVPGGTVEYRNYERFLVNNKYVKKILVKKK